MKKRLIIKGIPFILKLIKMAAGTIKLMDSYMTIMVKITLNLMLYTKLKARLMRKDSEIGEYVMC